MKIIKKCFALCMALMLAISLPARGVYGRDDVLSVARATAAVIALGNSAPGTGSTGGDWAVIALARGGFDLPDSYLERYRDAATQYIIDCGGVLHSRKYTEYSRMILALTAAGADPTQIAGYNLVLPLGDFDKTVWQGINGAIWALIALDSGGYEIPLNPAAKTQATRQLYIDLILARQLDDGGWSLGLHTADADVTAMALQALSQYRSQPEVAAALQRGVECLSSVQGPDGGFSSWGEANAESCAQVIVALCALGVDLEDTAFVKNGVSVLDCLLSYYIPGRGFAHTQGAEADQMATEQALCALAACLRAQRGESALYKMAKEPAAGRHPDVRAAAVIRPGKTFLDISAPPHKNREAIEALACRGIISGTGKDSFAPDKTVTRAEFSALVVRGLGLPLLKSGGFADVPDGHWAAAYIGAAGAYGIVSGRSDTVFDPVGIITVEEAAVMAARAAALCGLNVDAGSQSNGQMNDILPRVSSWARESVAYCHKAGFIDTGLAAAPGQAILRCETAQMLYGMLGAAGLLGGGV